MSYFVFISAISKCEVKVNMRWDAFISHASEDKDAFVRPLAQALSSLGAAIWYDEFTLNVGDSLSESIDKGLAQSKHGIVVISRAFIKKPWPKQELRGLVTRELEGQSQILPIWHEIDKQQVSNFSPTLADKVAVRTSDSSAQDIALQILMVIRPDLYKALPRAELIKRASGQALVEIEEELQLLRQQLSEFQCPHCRSQLTHSIDAPVDPEEKHWDVFREFECGYREFGGIEQSPCPASSNFPLFDEFELKFVGPHSDVTWWTCIAEGKTVNALKIKLPPAMGHSKKEAEREMKNEYEQRAKPWLRPL